MLEEEENYEPDFNVNLVSANNMPDGNNASTDNVSDENDANIDNTIVLNINEFDATNLPENPKILTIGKRGCGKSFLTMDLIHHINDNNKIDKCIIFSPKDNLNKFYEQKINAKCVQYEFKECIIDNIIENQKNTNNRDRILIVLDDCIYSGNQFVGMNDFYLNASDNNISFILSLQYPMGLNPVARECFNQIFLLKEDMKNNKERMYDHYGGIFPEFESFNKVFDKCTENYGCLTLINNDEEFNDFNCVAKWYKAKSTDYINIQEIDEEVLHK